MSVEQSAEAMLTQVCNAPWNSGTFFLIHLSLQCRLRVQLEISRGLLSLFRAMFCPGSHSRIRVFLSLMTSRYFIMPYVYCIALVLLILEYDTHRHLKHKDPSTPVHDLNLLQSCPSARHGRQRLLLSFTRLLTHSQECWRRKYVAPQSVPSVQHSYLPSPSSKSRSIESALLLSRPNSSL